MRDRDGVGDRPREPGEVNPWALAGLGLQFAVALVLFGYAGQWVDQRLGTSPVGLLAGVLVGAGGTFYLSYRRLTAPRTPSAPNGSPPEAKG
jgi:F0F1-type ATP synthase assembly protein I